LNFTNPSIKNKKTICTKPASICSGEILAGDELIYVYEEINVSETFLGSSTESRKSFLFFLFFYPSIARQAF
jgi:hypothetical protein